MICPPADYPETMVLIKNNNKWKKIAIKILFGIMLPISIILIFLLKDILYQNFRGRYAVARTNLEEISRLRNSYWAKFHVYPESFYDFTLPKSENSIYIYAFNKTGEFLPNSRYSPEELDAMKMTSKNLPVDNDCLFTAIGNIDTDKFYDVWCLTGKDELLHLQDDYKNRTK